MTDLLPTEKQTDYAEILVDRLDEADHWQTELYRRRVTACDDIADMSELIDEMKAKLEDVKGMDDFVSASHRGEL